MLLQGLFVPLTCPFYRDGSSYLRKLEHNVARYSLSPAAGLLTLVPDTEAAGLTDAEADAVLASVAQFAAKEKVLLAGIEKNSVSAALHAIRQAERLLYDAAVLAPPPQWARLVHRSDARELLTFFRIVADSSPLPLILWSESKTPSLQLPLELLAEMARHPNVLGLLDRDLDRDRLLTIQQATEGVEREVTVTMIFEAVTRRMLQPAAVATSGPALVSAEALRGGAAVAELPVPALATAALKTRTRKVSFQVIAAGRAGHMVPLLQAGATAVLPTLAACAPQGCFEAFAAWKDGDLPLAEERAARFTGIEALLEEFGPAAVKAGCDFNGYFGGMPRLPRLPLTGEQREAVEKALAVLRN